LQQVSSINSKGELLSSRVKGFKGDQKWKEETSKKEDIAEFRKKVVDFPLGLKAEGRKGIWRSPESLSKKFM
jgi:hypothetical protein